MTNPLVNELDIAFQQGHHQHVIRQSTLALDIVDFQLSKLDIRARSWSACGKFENALEDARHMQQLAPLSPRGYYRQGVTYAQLGYHSNALEMYKHTAEAADDDDALRYEIDNAIKESTRQLEKKIDLINKLPMDIVLRIAPMLIGGDQGYHACLDVSMAWRDRLLQSSTLSYGIDAWSNSGLRKILSKGHDQTIRFSQHVRSLAIRTNDEPFYAFLDRGRFTSIKSLSISSLDSSYDDLERPYCVLQKLNSTLRHLEIVNVTLWMEDMDSSMALAEILDACTNLTSLKIDKVVLDRGGNDDQPPTYPTLRQLELDTQKRLDNIEVERILRSFPSLQRLRIRGVQDCKVLSWMHEYCPRLQHLEFNRMLLKKKHPPSPPSPASGLRSLYINANHTRVAMDDIIDIVIRHCTTLEDLVIDVPHEIRAVDPPPSWDKIEHAAFTRLRHVTLAIRDPKLEKAQEPYSHFFCRFFENILCHSPNVETLLVFGAAIDKNVVHFSLKHLHHLHTMEIRNLDFGGVSQSVLSDREDMLRQAFEELASQSRLKTLKIVPDYINVALLESISRFKDLKTLSIAHFGASLGDHHIQFLSNLAETLEGLKLKVDDISDSVIYQLPRLKRLQHLDIDTCAKGPSDTAFRCLSACLQLKTLRLCRPVDSEVVKCIQMKIPNVQYKPHRR